jgi:exopolysaccharide biosynthesis polyprenyl glycosylphosphotransferase
VPVATSTRGADPLTTSAAWEPEGSLTLDDSGNGRARFDRVPVQRTRRRRWLVRRSLVAADVVGISAAFASVEILAGPGSGTGNGIPFSGELMLFAVSLPLWLASARAMGLYARDDERPEHTTVDDLVGVFLLITVVVWLTFVGSSITGVASPDQGKSTTFWAVAIGCVVFARSGARMLVRRSRKYVQNALIVGTDRVGQLIARKLLQHPEFGINVVGFVDGSPRTLRVAVEHIPVVGDVEGLVDTAVRLDVDRVVIAFSRQSSRQLMELTRDLQVRGIQVDIVPRLFEAFGPSVSITSIEGVQLVSLPPRLMTRGAVLLKRAFDLASASVLLLVTWPLFLAIALWIKVDSPGPVLFRQTRLGRHERPFVALKFRTMRNGTSHDEHRDYIRRAMDRGATPEGNGLYKLDRTDSVTRPGRLLRKTSLDELPQLLNVVRGNMSLVGPRPCIPYETQYFEPHHFERFAMPAGITGLWQVKARAHSTFVEALELDVAYVRSWSFGLDLFLLLQTPLQVLRPRGTS